MSSGKTIVVTGAGGYVGSALALALADAGHAVTGFGHGGNFPALRARATRDLDLVSGDLVDGDALRRVTRGADVVVHAASVTGEVACRRDMPAAVRAIVRGTRMVVDAVAENTVPLLVHVSTYAVYSTFQSRPMPLAEDAELLPDDLYGTLKAEAEWEASRVPSIILRLTNVYGRGSGIVRKTDVFGHFVRAIEEGRPLRMFGDGRQGNDFVHVDDVCRVIAGLIAVPRRDRPAVLNVGSGEVTSVRRLVDIFVAAARQRLGREVSVVSEEAPRDKIWPDRWVSTRRLVALFPWFPRTSLDEGVTELLAA
jgi:UDP-glucose 4-epimerase